MPSIPRLRGPGLILCALFIYGCSDARKETQNEKSGGTPPDTKVSSNEPTLKPSMVAPESKNKSTLTLESRPFPDSRFIDLGGRKITVRDFHGYLTVVCQLPSTSKIEAIHADILSVANMLSNSRFASYQRCAVVLPAGTEVPEGLFPADSHVHIWRASEEAVATEDEATLMLVDPSGNIRAELPAIESFPHDSIADAVDSIWNQQVPFLPEVLLSTWMEYRRESQLEASNLIPVVHDFKFTDIRNTTGIQFLHQIVDDAAIDYKGVHYDHGSGVAIADVDGDGLIDIYFVNQQGPSELYRNVGDGTFEDITARAGVAVGDRITVAASFADIDNDSDPDLYVTSVREGNLLFLNDGTGKFQEVSSDYHVDYGGHSSASVFFDYDRDGFLDLLVCNVGQYTTDATGRGGYYIGFKDAFSGHLKPERTEISRLYRNLGGRDFQDVTKAVGLEDASWTGDAAFFDVNNDGWLDLYLLDMQGNDEYFENQQGKGFARKSREIFPMTPWGAMGVSVRDFDNDLDLDLFITDMHSDMSKDILADIRSEASMSTFFTEEKQKATMQLPESLLKSEGASLYGNALFRNNGNATFTECSDETNAENYWPWGLSSGDFNADGLEDVFITSSMNYPFRYGVNSLLLNDGTRFHDAEFITGVEPRAGQRTAQPWMNVDTAAAKGTLLEKVTDGQSGVITVWGALGSRASVVLDFDGDGDLDIITGEFNDRPLVLQNNFSDDHVTNHITITLKANAPEQWASSQPPTGAETKLRSSRDAIGARVVISSGEQKWMKYYDGKTGYLAQGVPRIYCGLGDRTEVDSIIVKWPDGTETNHTGPWQSGRQVIIEQQD